ncbi:hypothetical protein SAMN05216389_102181 [Oceanobacillus limi]|uniref:Uncharacterized protein n=1 Tax=Oceanobacillus limi TaxID=930131 RepID=A0A1H9ZDH4_9BACI|nr:hypothetical protein [Oceanobacillus limi]SES78893.1 hypothetical protein SAMN05216389_102181 [Oceanobacillus limi]
MKKFKVFVLASLIALLVPTSAFASTDNLAPISSKNTALSDPSGWQFKGSDEVSLYVGGSTSSGWVTSEGGNAQVRVRNISSANCYTFSLWEYDPNNANDQISQKKRYCGEQDLTIYDISGWKDGSDNDLEIYAKLEQPGTNDSSVYLYFYD